MSTLKIRRILGLPATAARTEVFGRLVERYCGFGILDTDTERLKQYLRRRYGRPVEPVIDFVIDDWRLLDQKPEASAADLLVWLIDDDESLEDLEPADALAKIRAELGYDGADDRTVLERYLRIDFGYEPSCSDWQVLESWLNLNHCMGKADSPGDILIWLVWDELEMKRTFQNDDEVVQALFQRIAGIDGQATLATAVAAWYRSQVPVRDLIPEAARHYLGLDPNASLDQTIVSWLRRVELGVQDMVSDTEAFILWMRDKVDLPADAPENDVKIAWAIRSWEIELMGAIEPSVEWGLEPATRRFVIAELRSRFSLDDEKTEPEVLERAFPSGDYFVVRTFAREVGSWAENEGVLPHKQDKVDVLIAVIEASEFVAEGSTDEEILVALATER